MKRKPGLLLLVVFSLLVAACGGATAGGGAGGTVSGSQFRSAQPPVKGSLAVTGPGGAATQPAPGVNDVVPPVANGPRVIRTAQVGVEVANGSFDSTINKVFGIATGAGGYVAGSNASTDSGALRTGSVSFEVPSGKFDDALSQVRALGTVQDLVINGQDVSAQYVDLQARLANEEAQRDAMLALLQKATTVQDIISVQNQLGQITGQIEELKGQIDYLDHVTTYSTISVSIHESAVATRPSTDAYGFWAALSQGFHGFVVTLDYLLVGVGYAGPFLVLLALFGLAWRLRRRFAL